MEDENTTDEETIANTANYLRNLPSRRTHRERGARTKTGKESMESKENTEDEDDASELNTFEERMRDERRAEVRRRFRYVYEYFSLVFSTVSNIITHNKYYKYHKSI